MSQNDICMLIGFIPGVAVGIIAMGLLVLRSNYSKRLLPKEPSFGNYDEEFDRYDLFCSRCGETVGCLENEDGDGIYKYNIHWNYCPECGQAIAQSWEEEFYGAAQEQKCRVCGCTQNNACVGGCYWVEEDLCSKCAENND